MKRCLTTALIVMCLLLLAGCGKKMISAADDTSLYPYGWQENSDGSLTVEISGQWEKDCTWQPAYDENILEVTPEKKDGRFTVKGLAAGAGEINFYLFRADGESADYCIWLYVSSTSVGDVRVVEYTHEEPRADGDFTYWNAYNGNLLFTVYSAHEWQYRLLQSDVNVECNEVTETSQTYEISAETGSEAQIELWDTEAPRKLMLDVYAESDGYVYVRTVEESEDTSLTADVLDAFWQELDIAPALPGGITAEDCKIVRNDSGMEEPYGCLYVSIGGKEYQYLISRSEELADLYAMEPMIDEHDKVIEATSFTETLTDDITAEVFSSGNEVSVIWETGGSYFVLCGEDMETDAAVTAARQIVGGGNG